MDRRLTARTTVASLILGLVTLSSPAANSPVAESRPRLLVLTDIGGDPDDQQSLVRLLHYANEFEIEGFIASASGTPGELKEAVTKPELIREIITAYGEVQPNLVKHAAGFPQAGELLSRVKSGNPQRGREAVGEGRDTEGSRFIAEVADRPDPRPLNITIWGGQTDFAQACWAVRNERGADGLKKFLSGIRVYDINDQDHIFEWMFAEFAPPFYVLANAYPGHDKREGVYRGIYLGGDESLVSRDWMEQNIRQDHGPLGALYPPRTWTAPNPHSAIKEGDTPSWFFFLPRGFNNPNFPNWGSWGGRFQQATNGVWRDVQDIVTGVTDARSTVSRWRTQFQNDFAARLDWCVREPRDANHAPIAVINGNLDAETLQLTARSGEEVRLDASRSLDPEANAIRFRWWRYWEVGTWRGDLPLKNMDRPELRFLAPETLDRRTLHLILEVTDDGTPSLTSTRRVIVELQPSNRD